MQPFGELDRCLYIQYRTFWLVRIEVLPDHTLVSDSMSLTELKLAHARVLIEQLAEPN